MLFPRQRCLACLVLLGLGFGLLTFGAHAARPAFNNDPDYLIDTWETEDGLPENSATAMVQSPDGYLWFGTFNGLVRFDGARFTVFDPANTPALPAAGIVNLHLDRRGWLWVSTYRGLVVREGTRWRAFGTNEGWTGDLVRTFAERNNGDLLLTSFNGMVLEFANGRLSALPSPPGRTGIGYHGFADVAGRWWVVQQWYVGSWDGQRWIEAASLTNLSSTINGAGRARDGGIWLKAGAALYKLRQGNVAAQVDLPHRPGTPWSITEDSQGNVWLATFDHGLWRVDPAGRTRVWTTTNGLSYNGTRFVFEDRERNLWVGTSGGGLQRFKQRRFQSYGIQNGLDERNVTSVSPDAAGGVWMATYAKGMFRWSDGVIASVPLPPENNTLNVVNSVLTDRTGRTWFGTWGQSVCVTDSQGFRRIPPAQVGGFNILSLFEDSRARIWVGGERQASIGENETFREVPISPGSRFAGVRCFAEDRAGVLWASNLEGLFRCENDQFVEVRQDGKSLRDITCIKADSDGTLWLGLHRGGLLRRWGETSTRVELGTGAATPGVHGILEDEAGFFWMPSGRGVLRAARKDLAAAADVGTGPAECLVLDLSDGLPSVECAGSRQPVCARDKQSRLWFATLKGAAMIDPAELQLNTNPPPVLIESVAFQAPAPVGTNGRETVTRVEGPFPERVLLPAGSRRIEIQYTAPSFAAPEKVRFQFKLAGIDADWRDAGGRRRTAQFYELSPGNYLFRVRAANNDGVWNESGASLAFVVQPFFWQATWFRIVAVLILVSLVGVVVWWRDRARHRHELLQLERARRHEAELAHVSRVSIMGELSASMAHELNQPLTAILTNAQAGQRFLAGDKPDVDEFREILKDIVYDTTRARDVIRHLRALVKRSEPDFTRLDLGEVIQEVVGFLHGDIVARNTRVTLALAPDLPAIQGNRIQLQQVIINLLLNAFDAMNANPVPERLVAVSSLMESPTVIRVTVADHGTGIPVDKLDSIFDPFYTTKPEGMGMGLSVTRTIVEAHGGRIWAENNAGRGASIHFTLRVPEPG